MFQNGGLTCETLSPAEQVAFDFLEGDIHDIADQSDDDDHDEQLPGEQQLLGAREQIAKADA